MLESKIVNSFIYHCFVETRTYVHVDHALLVHVESSTDDQRGRRTNSLIACRTYGAAVAYALEASDDGHI